MEDRPSNPGTPTELQEPPLSTEQEEDQTATPETDAQLAAAAPELLANSFGEYARAWWTRLKAGDSGALPIVVGLIVIIIFFQAERSQFDSATNLVNLFQQTSIYVLLGAAQLFALILSEIDLSVGYVLAVGGFVIAELISTPDNVTWWVAVLAGLGVTGAIGFIQGTIITRLHVPSFVVTLAGLLIWEGVTIVLADSYKAAVGGVQSVSPTSPIYHLVNNNMSTTLGWIVLVVLLGTFAAVKLISATRRRAQGLSAPPLSVVLLQIAATAIGGILLVYICNKDRSTGITPLKGIPWVVPFIGLVLFIYSMFLGRTRTGRYMYAIGANPEAARRAGINVQRVRRIAFTLSAMTAGIAGLVYASFLGSISTDVPGGNYTLYAVAAAVIGGASLFGGRGKPLQALLGGIVIGVVFNGLALMGISAQGQYIASGIVLLAAATVDSLIRRRSATGTV